MPTVSVIVPVYNGALFVGLALDSILEQTRPPSEIIVVDDGSTDETPEVLKLYQDHVTIVRQENRGVAGAKNTGIKLASGEWIAFLDADDLWLPEKLEKQIEYIKKNPQIDVVYSDFRFFSDEGILDEKCWQPTSSWKGNFFHALVMGPILTVITVLARRSCFDKIGLFDESFRICSDYEFWMRLARNHTFGYIEEVLALYRQHDQNNTRNRALNAEYEIAAVEKILKLYPETIQEIGKQPLRRRKATPLFDAAYDFWQEGEMKQARKYFRSLLYYWPTYLPAYSYYAATFLPSPARSIVRKIGKQMFPKLKPIRHKAKEF